MEQWRPHHFSCINDYQAYVLNDNLLLTYSGNKPNMPVTCIPLRCDKRIVGIFC